MNEINASIIEAEKNGVSVPETKKLLYLAQIIFNRGDYVNAYAKLREAKSSLLLETKGEFNLLYAIKNKPIESLGIFISLSLIGIGSGYLIRIRFLKRKLRLLGEEEMLLLQLIKVVQRDCFENNRMSMGEYNESMVQYENRLSEIIQTRINIETKVANLMRFSGKRNALIQEQARLLALIRQVQDDYLNREKIETRAYENMLKTYSGRLNGIQEELAFMDAQEQIKKANGFWKRLGGKG
jgi:hypothetical protein